MNETAPPVQGGMRVLVCHAPAQGPVWQQYLEVAPGSTVGQALAASDFAKRFPGRDPWQDGVGIHGKIVSPAQLLKAEDRIEIYRPLVFDPMTSRRRRAAHRQRRNMDHKI